MGAWVEAGCVEGVAICETRGECVPVTGGPADVVAAALDAVGAGVWTVVPRGYDNLAASPTVGAKEEAVGIPPAVGSRGRWCACSQFVCVLRKGAVVTALGTTMCVRLKDEVGPRGGHTHIHSQPHR